MTIAKSPVVALPADLERYALAYQMLQNRLDTYRNTGIAVAGGTLAFMAVFYSVFFDKNPNEMSEQNKYIMLIVVITIGCFSFMMLKRLQNAFVEMSAIIVRLDKKLGFFDPGFDEHGSLYPARWAALAGRNNDRGWPDLVLAHLLTMTIILTIFNVGAFIYVFLEPVALLWIRTFL